MARIWEKAQIWEREWWGDCVNTYNEEEKQLVYANRMGLDLVGSDKTPYVFDLHGASVIDIGGGPVSLLLKCINFKAGVVIDPLPLPIWAAFRYRYSRIRYSQHPAEKPSTKKVSVDEIWIYNCLQHTQDPKKVVANAKRWGKLIRIFEWLDTPPNVGHPQTLTEKELNEWLGGEGKVEEIEQHPCVGKAYYGIFPT